MTDLIWDVIKSKRAAIYAELDILPAENVDRRMALLAQDLLLGELVDEYTAEVIKRSDRRHPHLRGAQSDE